MATVNKITVSTKGESHMNLTLEQKMLMASKIAAIPAANLKEVKFEQFGDYEFVSFEATVNNHLIQVEIRETMVMAETPHVTTIRQVDSLAGLAVSLIAPMQKKPNGEQRAYGHSIYNVGKVTSEVTSDNLPEMIVSISIDGVLRHIDADIVLTAAKDKLNEICATTNEWSMPSMKNELESIALTQLLESL